MSSLGGYIMAKRVLGKEFNMCRVLFVNTVSSYCCLLIRITVVKGDTNEDLSWRQKVANAQSF